MTLHPIHSSRQDRMIEISEPTYHRLMHDLSLAGANRPTSYGHGWAGDHPDHGRISVARVSWPARHREHPPFAFFLECPDKASLDHVRNSVA